jgi:hypothetical protein
MQHSVLNTQCGSGNNFSKYTVTRPCGTRENKQTNNTFELLLFLTSNVILFKCHLSLIGGLLTVNGVFYCCETRFYTSSNLYFIKQDHQIATIDIQKV